MRFLSLTHLLAFRKLAYKDEDNSELFSTVVKETEIELFSKSLWKTLHISYHSLTLNEILLDDEEILSRFYLPSQEPNMANNKLKPIPRLIGCILAYNICPKMGSFNYFSHDLASCIYAIMAKIEFNWAKIFFDTLAREHISLLYGAYLTHIFKKFKLDLAS